MASTLHCSACDKEIQSIWKYCRFCGTKQEKENVVENVTLDESASEIIEHKEEIAEEEKFDKELYEKVLSTRSKRNQLIRKRKELSNEVNSLLEQLQAGLITRDYASPKIKGIKDDVSKINSEEKDFGDLPLELPVEILLDQIVAAENRMKKIDELKRDEAVTKEALREAKKRALDSLELLKDQHSRIAGHLRIWKGELEMENNTNRKELEQLYIRFKTGELTEETYVERKNTLSESITNNDNVISMLATMID